MKKNRILLCLLLLTLGSCKKENEPESDISKPNITIKAPSQEEILSAGSTLHFEAEFSDNVELNRYKIDIHDAGGHVHKKSLTTNWIYQKEFDLTGKQYFLAKELIEIPSDANPSEYHLVVYCTDKSGNEQIVFTEIQIESNSK